MPFSRFVFGMSVLWGTAVPKEEGEKQPDCLLLWWQTHSTRLCHWKSALAATATGFRRSGWECFSLGWVSAWNPSIQRHFVVASRAYLRSRATSLQSELHRFSAALLLLVSRSPSLHARGCASKQRRWQLCLFVKCCCAGVLSQPCWYVARPQPHHHRRRRRPDSRAHPRQPSSPGRCVDSRARAHRSASGSGFLTSPNPTELQGARSHVPLD